MTTPPTPLNNSPPSSPVLRPPFVNPSAPTPPPPRPSVVNPLAPPPPPPRSHVVNPLAPPPPPPPPPAGPRALGRSQPVVRSAPPASQPLVLTEEDHRKVARLNADLEALPAILAALETDLPAMGINVEVSADAKVLPRVSVAFAAVCHTVHVYPAHLVEIDTVRAALSPVIVRALSVVGMPTTAFNPAPFIAAFLGHYAQRSREAQIISLRQQEAACTVQRRELAAATANYAKHGVTVTQSNLADVLKRNQEQSEEARGRLRALERVPDTTESSWDRAVRLSGFPAHLPNLQSLIVGRRPLESLRKTYDSQVRYTSWDEFVKNQYGDETRILLKTDEQEVVERARKQASKDAKKALTETFEERLAQSGSEKTSLKGEDARAAALAGANAARRAKEDFFSKARNMWGLSTEASTDRFGALEVDTISDIAQLAIARASSITAAFYKEKDDLNSNIRALRASLAELQAKHESGNLEPIDQLRLNGISRNLPALEAALAQSDAEGGSFRPLLCSVFASCSDGRSRIESDAGAGPAPVRTRPAAVAATPMQTTIGLRHSADSPVLAGFTRLVPSSTVVTSAVALPSLTTMLQKSMPHTQSPTGSALAADAPDEEKIRADHHARLDSLEAQIKENSRLARESAQAQRVAGDKARRLMRPAGEVSQVHGQPISPRAQAEGSGAPVESASVDEESPQPPVDVARVTASVAARLVPAAEQDLGPALWEPEGTAYVALYDTHPDACQDIAQSAKARWEAAQEQRPRQDSIHVFKKAHAVITGQRGEYDENFYDQIFGAQYASAAALKSELRRFARHVMEETSLQLKDPEIDLIIYIAVGHLSPETLARYIRILQSASIGFDHRLIERGPGMLQAFSECLVSAVPDAAYVPPADDSVEPLGDQGGGGGGGSSSVLEAGRRVQHVSLRSFVRSGILAALHDKDVTAENVWQAIWPLIKDAGTDFAVEIAEADVAQDASSRCTQAVMAVHNAIHSDVKSSTELLSTQIEVNGVRLIASNALDMAISPVLLAVWLRVARRGKTSSTSYLMAISGALEVSSSNGEMLQIALGISSEKDTLKLFKTLAASLVATMEPGTNTLILRLGHPLTITPAQARQQSIVEFVKVICPAISSGIWGEQDLLSVGRSIGVAGMAAPPVHSANAEDLGASGRGWFGGLLSRFSGFGARIDSASVAADDLRPRTDHTSIGLAFPRGSARGSADGSYAVLVDSERGRGGGGGWGLQSLVSSIARYALPSGEADRGIAAAAVVHDPFGFRKALKDAIKAARIDRGSATHGATQAYVVAARQVYQNHMVDGATLVSRYGLEAPALLMAGLYSGE